MSETPTMDEHLHEDALEPRHLVRRANVVIRAGILMLGAGTSGLRVREVMSAVSDTVGLRETRAQVTFTNIILTIRRRNTFRTQVAEIPNPGVNAHRIDLLQRLGRNLPERATVAEVDAMLDEVENTPRLYPVWLLALLVGVACASVTLLANGSWREILAVLPASGFAFWLQRRLTAWQINHLAVVLTAAATATGGYLVLTRLLDLALGGPSSRMAAGLICAAIFLIPGFPLVTAGLDLTRIDLDAGIPRLVYAAMVLLAITIGVWLVVTVSGVSPDSVLPPSVSPGWLWVIWLAASFFAVYGWASMFNSPLPVAVASGVVAMLGNVPRLLLLEAGVSSHVATFVGCFVMGLLCAMVGAMFDLNKIIMTVPTVLVSIPGASALRTLIYFDQANVVQALQHGVDTALVVIAMVAGLSGARMLTDPEWAFTHGNPTGTAWRLLGRRARRPVGD